MVIDRAGALIDLIREHHLLEPAQLEELSRTPDASDTPPQVLGQCLIELGWLTPYQVDCLIQQRMEDLFLGSYHLLDRLGQGENGPAFQARKPGKAGTVVVKSIPKSRLADPHLLARFQQEVRTAAQLRHPNIAPVAAVGQHGNSFLFAREFVPGADLGRMVRELGPLPPFLACNAVRQTALALQFAHDKGLSHRRVKAFNLIVVDQPGTDGTVKLVDFGLGQLKAGATTNVDVSGDLAALGQTLCFLMTGQTSPAAGLPAKVEEIVRRLGPDAANGFATAEEVSHALAPLCHEPPPPGPAIYNGDIAAPPVESADIPFASPSAAAILVEMPAHSVPCGIDLETKPQAVELAVPLEGIAVPVMGTVGIAAAPEEPSVAPPPPESPAPISAEATPGALAEVSPSSVVSEPAIAAPSPLFDSAPVVAETPFPAEKGSDDDWPRLKTPPQGDPAPAVGIEPALSPIDASRPIPLTDYPEIAPSAPFSPPGPAGHFTDQPPTSTAYTADEPSGYPMGGAVETAPRPAPAKKKWRKKDKIWLTVGALCWIIVGILVVIILMIRSNRPETPKNSRPNPPGKQKNKSRAELSTKEELLMSRDR